MDDYIKRSDAIKGLDCLVWSSSADHTRKNILTAVMRRLPTADVVEVGKPYFYEEGYVLKDFHNEGVHRYFVIEREDT